MQALTNNAQFVQGFIIYLKSRGPAACGICLQFLVLYCEYFLRIYIFVYIMYIKQRATQLNLAAEGCRVSVHT